MAIEGPLQELGIHDVFQLLDLSRKTGVLRVTSELRKNVGRVWFDSGAVAYAELRTNIHPLGEMLVRAGTIMEADLNRARDMQRKGDTRRIGEILVDIGTITERELNRQVRFQTEEVIFEMMSWQEGHFSFEEGHDAPIPGDPATRVSTEALLMEGARRIDEWSRMERTIPHVGVIPTFSDVGEGELDLLPVEWEILAAVDGERDVRALASLSALSGFGVAKILFGLEAAGVLAMVLPSDPREVEVSEDATDLVTQVEIALDLSDVELARTTVETALAQHPQSAELHFEAARVYTAKREFADAEDYCRQALRYDPSLEPAHRLLGDVLAQRGRLSDAVEWWERWLRIQEQAEIPNADTDRLRDAVRAAQSLNSLLGNQ
jgi:hypothetical protein